MVNALNELKKAMTETGATSYKELKEAGRPVRYMGNKKVLQDNVRDQKTGQGPLMNPRSTPCRWPKWKSTLRLAKSGCSR